jgi:hypothetical protein
VSRSIPYELSSPNASGETIEADAINRLDALESVPDSEATWHDARVDGLLEPSRDLPAIGVVLVEDGTEVESKAAQIRMGKSNRRGRWFVKREAHDRLLEAGGVYLLVVYEPRSGLPWAAARIVPASVLDDLLKPRWYDVDQDRSEDEVVQLPWSAVCDPTAVEAGGRR